MWLGGVTWWLHTTVLTMVLRVAECRILVWNSIRKQTPQLVAPKSDTPLQRPAASAFASSSVNLAPTKIRQASHPANHVQLECIKIRRGGVIARVVELGNTMAKRNARQRLIVNLIATLDCTLCLTKVYVSFVRKVSGKIRVDSHIVNLIATPDHTLYPTKVRVSFVRKVSGKIKMDSQIAKAAIKVNTTNNSEAWPKAIVEYVKAASTQASAVMKHASTAMQDNLISTTIYQVLIQSVTLAHQVKYQHRALHFVSRVPSVRTTRPM